MSRLIEAARTHNSHSTEIAPHKNIGLEAVWLLPHQSEFVSNHPPLNRTIPNRIKAHAVIKHIRDGADINSVQQQTLTELINASRKPEKSFLRFATLRECCGTGFEKYGAGYFTSAQDMAEAIAQLGVNVLYEIKKNKADASDFIFLDRLWKFIAGGEYDKEMATVLHSTLGSMIAQLKADTRHNPKANEVRNVMANLVYPSQVISYQCADMDCLQQSYQLPNLQNARNQLAEHLPVEIVNPNIFRGSDKYWGYIFMLTVGKMGHPIIRAGINMGLLL